MMAMEQIGDSTQLSYMHFDFKQCKNDNNGDRASTARGLLAQMDLQFIFLLHFFTDVLTVTHFLIYIMIPWIPNISNFMFNNRLRELRLKCSKVLVAIFQKLWMWYMVLLTLSRRKGQWNISTSCGNQP